MNERKNDPVNNPKHYADGCSVECIDMMQTALGWDGVIYFCLGNAYKYLWRHQLKNNPEEDLAKAKWYIDRAVVMAQDDREDYGYLLSVAEPLMRLIELYTIMLQSKKALYDHVEMEDVFINKKHAERKDIFNNWFFGGTENCDMDCMDEDDWMFVNSDAKVIYNRLNNDDAKGGHVTGDDRKVVLQALDKIMKRCEKHLKEDSK